MTIVALSIVIASHINKTNSGFDALYAADDLVHLPGFEAEYLPGGIDLSVSMANDNMFFGMLDLILQPSYSDDLGLTYGLAIEAKTVLEDGIQIAIDWSTTMYADLVPEEYPGSWWYYDDQGRLFVEQSFTNSNLLRISADSALTAEPFYYRLAAGWRVLDSVNWASPLNATSHQFLMHWLINELFGTTLARMTVNVPDGKGVRHGFSGTGTLGLQFNGSHIDGRRRLRIFAETSGGYDTFAGGFIDGETGVSLSLRHRKRRISLRTQLSIGSHLFSDGMTNRATFVFTSRFGHVATDVTIFQRWGDLQNVVDYDRLNFNDFVDPIMIVGFRIDIGGRWE